MASDSGEAGSGTGTHGPSADSAERLLSTVIERGRPDDDLSQNQALRSVKAALFGRPADPIKLSRYFLLERLGAGGIGLVYAAYDPELDRKVAIKLLRAAGDSQRQSQGQARLVREAQAMAKVSHPNVIAVHDVGTYDEEVAGLTTGVQRRGVFVVMEYVDGLDLDAWAIEHREDWRATLAVFAAAGRGLAAAHGAGLVHRDFKPGNVLVGRDGRVRVLDFGLARAADETGASSDERPPDVVSETTGRADTALATPLTQTGWVLGTPAYMAPEQHEGEVADPRSDQYAFCVALYEALYGARPFGGRTVAQVALAKRSDPIATEPPRANVPLAVHRAIVRGLSVEPGDRFGSMDSLLQAIGRHPRRRWRVAGAVAVALSGLGVGGFLASGTATAPRPCAGFDKMLVGVWDDDIRRASAEAFSATDKPFAADAWAAAQTGLDRYTDRWLRMRTEACEATLVRHEQSAQQMTRKYLCLDRRLARASELAALFPDADASLVQHAPAAVEALPRLSVCDLSPWLTTQTDDPMTRETDGRLARVQALKVAGRMTEALAEAEALNDDLRDGEAGPARARAALALGRIRGAAGALTDAQTDLHTALLDAERSGDEVTATAALLQLGKVATAQAEYADAERYLELAEAKIDHYALAAEFELDLLLWLGELRGAQGRPDEAAGLHRRGTEVASGSPEDQSLRVAQHLAGLANALGGGAPSAEVEALYQRAYDINVQRLGDDHPDVGMLLNSLGNAAAGRGDLPLALQRFERSIELLEAAYGPDNVLVGRYLNNLADTLARAGRPDEALAKMQRALVILQTELGAGHLDVAVTRANLANTFIDVGRPDAALEQATLAGEAMQRVLGSDHPQVGFAIFAEGRSLADLGRRSEAMQRYERARALWARTLGDDHPSVALCHRALGETAHLERDYAQAQVHLRAALRRLDMRPAPDPRDYARTQLILAAAMRASKPQQAAELHDEARRAYLDAGGTPDEIRDLLQWLGP